MSICSPLWISEIFLNRYMNILYYICVCEYNMGNSWRWWYDHRTVLCSMAHAQTPKQTQTQLLNNTHTHSDRQRDGHATFAAVGLINNNVFISKRQQHDARDGAVGCWIVNRARWSREKERSRYKRLHRMELNWSSRRYSPSSPARVNRIVCLIKIQH